MHVLVLLAGVADPKWPLPSPPLAQALQAHAERHAVLSPFDEAALELALQVRDATPEATLSALVAGPPALARKVAEWRLDRVQHIALPGQHLGDPGAFAQALAAVAAAPAGPADLVLTGREFGDWDDGSVPALLAPALGLPHIGLALGLSWQDGAPWVVRERGARLEQVRPGGRVLLSVTNDARNKLRHPLMKNVMAARKLQIDTLAAPAAPPTLRAEAMALCAPPQRAAACRMLTGTLEEQARALAELLRGEGAAA